MNELGKETNVTSLLQVERVGPIAIVRINRPEMRNALGFGNDGPEFREKLGLINEDPSIQCVILTGVGKSFSAGGDMKQLRQWAADDRMAPRDFVEAYETGVHEVVSAVWNLKVPVIAAVNGAAIGLGNDLASLCDIRIAGRSAKFGATFLKIGLVPGDGGAWLLPRIVGWDRAAHLFFTGSVIDADTALDWRLVTEVVDDDQLMDRAMELANGVSAMSPYALRLTKKLMRAGLQQSFPDVMALSGSYQTLLHLGADHGEALDALESARAPDFTGR